MQWPNSARSSVREDGNPTGFRATGKIEQDHALPSGAILGDQGEVLARKAVRDDAAAFFEAQTRLEAARRRFAGDRRRRFARAELVDNCANHRHKANHHDPDRDQHQPHHLAAHPFHRRVKRLVVVLFGRRRHGNRLSEGLMPPSDTGVPAHWEVLHADAAARGYRLDQWLAAALDSRLSRSRIQALIAAGDVRVDGQAAVPSRKLAGGERIEWRQPPPEPAIPRAQPMPLAILFEDDDIIVIDKPAGLTVHPGAGQPDGTLVNALIAHCGDSLSGIGGVRRPGIVHRLDKDTSGVLVVAKNDSSHRALSADFADHGRSGGLQRSYLALVWERPPARAGTVNAPLGRASGDRTRRSVVAASRTDARHAVTHYRLVEDFDAAALVECRLETGRTHQIRVHMAHIGNPLVGDRIYGSHFASKARKLPAELAGRVQRFRRQALHAATLSFRHPASGEVMQFEAPLPADMLELVEAFRGYASGKP